MGAGMARNIAGAGLPLRVWNRSQDKAQELADVAQVADSVADAVEGADIVLTMLYDADSVVATMEQARGHLETGAVWLQQSTIGVAGCDRTIELAEDLGVTLVDAPVLGTKKPADDGALVVLASGPDDATGDRHAGVRSHRRPHHVGRRCRRREQAQAGCECLGRDRARRGRGVTGVHA